MSGHRATRDGEETLPPLRDELEIGPGPSAHDGSRTWTINDPSTGRFIRLGWMEFEVLLRWSLGKPSAIAAAVSAQTTLQISAAEVQQFAGHMQAANLLRAASPVAVGHLLRQYTAARQAGWAWRALKSYLFFRIPLLRPDRLYARLIRSLGWVFAPAFHLATLMAGLLGLLLASQQWDVFVNSFPYLATGEGVLLGLASLALLKILHECGHGLVAKRFGCRTRTAGIAVMLFVPMLYTDITDAWRLTSRYQRMLIGAAGIITELAVACWALLLWNVLPDGPLRDVAFFWATTAWVLTILVNANPLMRFDGYYILSDALDQPNLQDTAFRLGRWHMRWHLLGAHVPPPAVVDARRRNLLIVYAYATWIYRLILFLGIALLVYLMSFKLLGIFLAVVEIVWFIIRPIWQELRVWWKERRTIGLNRTMVRSIGVVVALILLAVVPWRMTVHGDALVGAERRSVLFAAMPGQVVEIASRPGQRVVQGELLFRLVAPQLEQEATLHRLTIASLGAQIEALSQYQAMVARVDILQHERDAARQSLASAEAALLQLDVRAPFSGEVVELAEPLSVREWVGRGEPLALVVDRVSTSVEALVAEDAVRRIAVGRQGVVYFRNPDLKPVVAVVEEIDTTALRTLPDPTLASTHGGPIPARAGPNQSLVPETPVYRVRLRPAHALVLDRMELASVRIEAEPESVAARLGRKLLGILIRESGF